MNVGANFKLCCSGKEKLARAFLDGVLPVPVIALEIKSCPPCFPEKKKKRICFLCSRRMLSEVAVL